MKKVKRKREEREKVKKRRSEKRRRKKEKVREKKSGPECSKWSTRVKHVRIDPNGDRHISPWSCLEIFLIPTFGYIKVITSNKSKAAKALCRSGSCF